MSDRYPDPQTSHGFVDCEACGDDGGWYVPTHRTATDGSQEHEWYPCPECNGDDDTIVIDIAEWEAGYDDYAW